MIHLPGILLRGLLIGLLISAPMGPIGMLVIQRTLNKGRWAAFFTGVGAAVSDIIYCLLTGLGMSFVTDFIETHKALLQLVGSVVLVGYAAYLFVSNPSRRLAAGTIRAHGGWRDLVTGFLLTFSNPLILFLIIGLFAQFDFLGPDLMFYHYVTGFIGIFAGAIAWWFSVTWFVNKMRSHFNLRSMWLLNRILASLILIMGAYGLFTALTDLI